MCCTGRERIMAARLLMGVVVVGLLAVHTQACTLPSAKIAPRVFAHYLPWFTNQCETLDARPRDGWCGPGDCSDVGNFQYRGQPAIGEYSQLCAGVLRCATRMHARSLRGVL